MQRSVRLPSGRVLTFFKSTLHAENFIYVWNSIPNIRKCSLVEFSFEGAVSGCLKAPETAPSFLQQNVTSA